MNPRGNIANLKPWKPGNSAPRRSRDVDRAIRLARKCAPEALLYVLEVLRDATESPRWRLRAAETILNIALPKDPSSLDRLLEERGGDVEFRVTFVSPGDLHPIALGDEPPQTNGHDPELEPIFVDP